MYSRTLKAKLMEEVAFDCHMSKEKLQIAFCANKSLCVRQGKWYYICIGRLKSYCISRSSISEDSIIVLHWGGFILLFLSSCLGEEGTAERCYSIFTALCFHHWRGEKCCYFIVLCYFFPFCSYSSATSPNSLWWPVVRSIASSFLCFSFSNNSGDHVVGETSQNDSTQTIPDSSGVQAPHSQDSPGATVSMCTPPAVPSPRAVHSSPHTVSCCQVLIPCDIGLLQAGGVIPCIYWVYHCCQAVSS